VSRRHELEQRLRKLGEIGEIMRSMKNLALMETRKLARFLDVQGESVLMIEAVAADFLQFHAQLALNAPSGRQAVLVIGAERGFCGDFNEELLKALTKGESPASTPGEAEGKGGLFDGHAASPRSNDAPILAVGGKLCARLEQHPALAGHFDGPTVAEDVPKTLNLLIPAIGRLQESGACEGLTVLHHRSGMEGMARKTLLPPFSQHPSRGPGHRQPPLLNLAPEQFFADLVHHYLFAALHEIFYTSLMAENQRRIQHIEGAIQRLQEKNETLARKSRTLRQEEITEEIEVILLSVEGAVQR
jgi:F-type H+-transporting ATPase subunit gamma